jgi:hypothetical protein
MKRLQHTQLLPVVILISTVLGTGQETGKNAAPLQQFQEQVDAYVKLRKMVTDSLPKMKPTPSAQDLADRKKQLATNLAEARAGASQGIIFTPAVAAEFRKLGRQAMDGQRGARVRESLKSAEPVQGQVRVNQVYPSSVPLQSMPPTLLMTLPKMPMELEYTLVGWTLVLRDFEAGLIVDYLPEAIP